MDTLHFKAFYDTPLGRHATACILPFIKKHLTEKSVQNILGVGFPFPYIDASRSTTILSLADLQAVGTPSQAKTHVRNSLYTTDNKLLPLPNFRFELAISVHCLEFTAHPLHLLKEFWRTLTPEGTLLLVVPNSKSSWSQKESTPFGCGDAYALPALLDMLKKGGFEPTLRKSTLFTPPTLSQAWLPAAPLIERFFPFCTHGGVWMIYAKKTPYRVTHLQQPNATTSGAVCQPS